MMVRACLAKVLGVVTLAALLGGCVNQTVKSTSVPTIDRASSVIPESQLLDVAIVIFDPGLDDYDGDEQIYPEVRKAESRYMPNLLSQAMQESGAWGAVRVVPDPQRISDLIVTGRIVHSDGETLELDIQAEDSRGYQWLDKTYQGQASAYAYQTTTRTSYDPFQAVYNNIANDLFKAMGALRPKDRENVRLTTDLLFAQSFSPDAFAGYLAKNRNGVYLVMRLPADNDPMLERIGTIRERDNMYVDTMQEYYNAFGVEMIGPYQEWRKLSYEEAIALQELQADARRRLIAGAVAVAAGIAGMSSNDSYSRSAGNVAVIGGGYLLKSGLEKRNEAQIHVQALEELGMSLEAEITPQVIDLEDRSITLSGNVEEQYAQWRELLADIYATEIGALEDPGANRAGDSAATPDTLRDQQ
ncbi:hypothetical protein [Seongchinamella unica]|uniref:hypothetical protein n=1 Tax=Seongchinamella unica TaxID=2547392 RepID=UPI001EEECDC4|nr:hypothetical protein [Seongchinamella unica]